MKTDLPLIKFNPKLPKLSKNEEEVLKILVEAGEMIAPLYQKQEEDAKLVSKEEIENAGKKDSSILSPYTAISRKDGKLVSTPYHIIYADYLKPIAEKLNKAGHLTENKEFGNFLIIQAKALIDGTYENAIIAGLQMKPYILDISISPVVHFDNDLFSAKAVYQSWVGIIDSQGTKRLNNYKSIIFNARKGGLIPGERIENFENVKAKTIDVILFSGFMARTKFVGVNMPMDLGIVEKSGSEVTIFNQTNDARMQEQLLPMLNKAFSPVFREEFSDEDIRRASLRYVALHELAHNYLYYKNAHKNLKDLLPPIYELAATLLGMRIAGSLLLKDVITNRQLESMIVAFICRSLYLIEQSKNKKFMMNYALGGAIFINFMLESDAIKIRDGITIPNFMKIFVSLNELSFILERLLSSGERNDAEAFIKKYGHLKIPLWPI